MLTRRFSLLLSGAFLGAMCPSMLRLANAQQVPTNLGFEQSSGYVAPVGWQVIGRGFQLQVDTVIPFAGKLSLRSRWVDSTQWSSERGGAGLAMRGYPAAFARGRKVHLTGYIRTESMTAGEAGLWVRVDAAGRPAIRSDYMVGRGARETTPWTRYDLEVPVDSGASRVSLGVRHQGNGTAWFDSLTVEVVGPAMPRAFADAPPPAPPKPAARPSEDLTRLLSDAELALPPDAVPAPAEDTMWTRWVQSHAHAIRSLGANDFSDLRFFAPLLRGKRIVQLGESGHGVAEFNMAKVRLIKYLHEELGYDVIAFEASLFECNRAQRSASTLSAERLMRACVPSVWWTTEGLPLFDYIKQTQATSHPLVLAGFDVQTSTPSARARPAFFQDVVSRVDAAYAGRVRERDSTYLSIEPARSDLGVTDATAAMDRWEQASVAVHRDRDVRLAFYDSLAHWLRQHNRALVAAMPEDPTAPMLARQLALSLQVLTRMLGSASIVGVDAFNLRDRAMADNVDFMLQDMFPGKKIMVWAANSHIQHNIGNRNAAGVPVDGVKMMGAWTAERHRAELYTIGLFMYRGSAASNDRQPYTIGIPSTGSLESILHRAPWRYAYVDLSKEKRSSGTSWMFTRIPARTFGTAAASVIPRNEFDGILFIDTTHPPQYLPNPLRP